MRPTDTTYLRDWIAAGVVAELVGDRQRLNDAEASGHGLVTGYEIVTLARIAYRVADAMLLVREERAQ